jgi:hypothetical protein
MNECVSEGVQVAGSLNGWDSTQTSQNKTIISLFLTFRAGDAMLMLCYCDDWRNETTCVNWDCDYQPAKQVRDCRENLPGPIPLVPILSQLNVPVSWVSIHIVVAGTCRLHEEGSHSHCPLHIHVVRFFALISLEAGFEKIAGEQSLSSKVKRAKFNLKIKRFQKTRTEDGRTQYRSADFRLTMTTLWSFS